jgi:hypothetical protein
MISDSSSALSVPDILLSISPQTPPAPPDSPSGSMWMVRNHFSSPF